MTRARSRPFSLPEAIAAFVAGHCFNRSKTHPYEFERIENLWRLHDAPRRNPADRRKEEWVAYRQDPSVVDRVARRHAGGRYFICHVLDEAVSDAPLRAAYKALGYRLLATEPFFVHTLARLPKTASPATITRVVDADLAARLGKAAKSKPLLPQFFAPDSPLKQYAALWGDDPKRSDIVGWVASIATRHGAWCCNLYVLQSRRRQGIGAALLEKMLRDLKKEGAPASVLLASHTGALLYPQLGYQRLGQLFIYAPPKALE